MKQIILFLFFIALFEHNYSAEIVKPTKDSRVIAGEYIVQLNDGVNVRDFIRTKSFRSKSGNVVALEQNVKRVHRLINGFSVRLSDEQVLELDSMSEVKRITYNGYTRMARLVYDEDVAWQLGRVCWYWTLPSTGPYFYGYDSSAGDNSVVYVLDTGIDENHIEFDDGLNRIGKDISIGFDNSDITDYHGTEVASLVAGQWNGVARKSVLFDIKIANESGSVEWDNIIAGMEAADFDYWDNYYFQPAVVLISIDTIGLYSVLDDAIKAMYTLSCVVIVVPAGNSDGGIYSPTVCDNTPAKSDFAMTVGATTLYDRRWSDSNYGKCVDFYAPGYDVVIASQSCDTTNCTTTGSGTSYSAAVIAGLAAYYITYFELCNCEDVWDVLYYNSNIESLSMPEYPMNFAGIGLNDVAWLRDHGTSKSLNYHQSIFNQTNLTSREKKRKLIEIKNFIRERPEIMARLPRNKLAKSHP